MSLPEWVLGELVADLSEFLGREQSEITEFMEKEKHISEYFDEYFDDAFITDKNRERLSAWLQESHYHLFDLTKWHINRVKYFAGLYEMVKRRSNWTLLDFGSGIGTHSILYAMKGWRATLCDVNEPCRAFSQRRFEKRGLEALFVKEVNEVNHFDKVLLLDTIGHLEKPEEALEIVAKSMKVGALIEITWDLFNEPVRSHIWSKENRASFENVLTEGGLVKTNTGGVWEKTR